MTFGELRQMTMSVYIKVAAEDIHGFYKKGDALYGDTDDMEVVNWIRTLMPNGYPVYTVFLKEATA